MAVARSLMVTAEYPFSLNSLAAVFIISSFLVSCFINAHEYNDKNHAVTVVTFKLIKIKLLCEKIKIMGILDFLTGNKNDKIQEFQSKGAIILDVRTASEYNQGAIPGSKNIPLQVLNGKINEIKKLNKPIITCCASGMRSGSAAAILKANGIEAMNGGGWFSLSKKL